jgi:hypothetical protein
LDRIKWQNNKAQVDPVIVLSIVNVSNAAKGKREFG